MCGARTSWVALVLWPLVFRIESMNKPEPSDLVNAASSVPPAPLHVPEMTLEALLSLKPQRKAVVTPSSSAVAASAQPAVAVTSDTSPSMAEQDLLLLYDEDSEAGRQMVQQLRDLLDAKVYLHTQSLLEAVGPEAHEALLDAVLVHFTPEHLEQASDTVQHWLHRQPHVPLIAVGNAQDPQATLTALRAGVQDFVDPSDPAVAHLPQRLQSLLQRKAVAPATSTLAPVASELAPMTAIMSARAGLGSSLLAAHLAMYLNQRLAQDAAAGHPGSPQVGAEAALDTLLLDLGVPHGDAVQYLDMNSDFDFLEAVQNVRRFDRKLVASGLAPHYSGLRALSVPTQAMPLREVSAADTDALLQKLRRYFRHLIVDVGGVSHAHIGMHVALQASQVWVVCDQSVSSMVATTELLRQLEALQLDRSRLRLIVGRFDRKLELEPQHIAEQLQLPLLATVPERRQALLQKINQGALLSVQQRREPYVQSLSRLVDVLTAADAHGSDRQTTVPGFLERLQGIFRAQRSN